MVGAGPETLRGGAWNNNRRNARVSCRPRDHPELFGGGIGLRVVVAPDFPLTSNAAALRSAAG
jgi:hypothetical protein